MFGGAAVAALLTAVMLRLALAAALDEVMHTAWAASSSPSCGPWPAPSVRSCARSCAAWIRIPRQTVETLKEDANGCQPEVIRSQIEGTRDELAYDIDRLADRTSPRRIAGDAGSVKSRGEK